MKEYLQISENNEGLTAVDVERKVQIVRYRYNLSRDQALELQTELNECRDMNEFVELLERKLLEFTVAKGRPSRQEFEDVNVGRFSDISA